MEIINIAIADITEYENNPKNNREATGAVAESIKEFGFKQPYIKVIIKRWEELTGEKAVRLN